MTRSCQGLAPLGLSTVPSALVKPPRIAECDTHLECQLCDIRQYGKDSLIVGRVVAAWTRAVASGASVGTLLDAQPVLGYLYPDHYLAITGKSQPIPA